MEIKPEKRIRYIHQNNNAQVVEISSWLSLVHGIFAKHFLFDKNMEVVKSNATISNRMKSVRQ